LTKFLPSPEIASPAGDLHLTHEPVGTLQIQIITKKGKKEEEIK
jgi:hypothetical protein